MVKTTLIIGLVLFACVVVAVPHAFAATFEVEVTENGFSQTSITMNSGDTISFVNTHMKASGNLEPHCISDPFAQPYTVESYWIIDNTDPTIGYTLYESQTFYDRCFTDFAPVSVTIGSDSDASNTSTEVEEDINSAPDYTGDVNEAVLQNTLAEITLELTNTLEVLAETQSAYQEQLDLVSAMEGEITILQNQVVDVTPYETQISELTTERDQWKQTAENWYAIALEQVRIMVEVLGL